MENPSDKFISNAGSLKVNSIYELHRKEKSAKFYRKVGRLFKLNAVTETELQFMASSAPKWNQINLVNISLERYGTEWVAKKP